MMKKDTEPQLNLMGKQLPSECTTIIVGRKMTADGSMIVARSEDWDAMFAKNLELYSDTDNGPKEFVARDSAFRCELPSRALGYSALAPCHLPGHWGSAGFNTAGVGMSATESIFSSDKALEADPLVENGVAENSVFNITLPYIRTAREGVERLGSLIERYGIAEGFGIGFVDQDEIWYLETASGHRWLACRIPEDKYFVTGNQSRFRDYNPQDTANFLASKDLIEFATAHKLYDPTKGKFDFHDLRKAFRFHYNDTEHDPYLHCNPKEPYRPVSIFRTTQTHILHVRPDLPQAIGRVDYMAMGMAALSVFLPYYQGINTLPEAYKRGSKTSSADSAYWKFRKVQALGMVNYNRYAPVIRAAYDQFEAETTQRQREMEEAYLQICETRPIAAQELLQNFSDKLLLRALKVTDDLTEELFTRLTADIQAEYLFHGA